MSGSTPPPGGGPYEPAPPPPPGGYGGYPGGPGGPGGYGAPGGYGGYPGGPTGTNKKAIWSLVLGIIGLLCCGLFAGIPALILGRSARREIDASGGYQTGRGLATAGYILGIVAIVLSVIGAILSLTGVINYNFSTSP